MAVGKTTCLRQLEPTLPEINFSYENPSPIVKKRNSLKININEESGFIENQRIFISAEIERYSSLPSGVTVFDRGPEDTECYTLNYPKLTNKKWKVHEILKRELLELRQCEVDKILFLTASDDELKKRMLLDNTRGRSTFNLDAFRIYEEWFLKNKSIDILDVTNLTFQEQTNKIKNWLLKTIPNPACS